MLAGSLAILLLSALLHALSNVPLKQARDKLAFAWWMLAAFCIPTTPAVFWIQQAQPLAWEIVVVSGLLEAVYFLALTRAYSIGDLSFVYPIARGSAPLFLLGWAALFLGENPSRYGVIGIVAVAAGLYLIRPAVAQTAQDRTKLFSAPMVWALMTGFVISVYSALDKIGVRYFPPFVYLWLVLSVCWLVLSLQLLAKNRRDAILREIAILPAGHSIENQTTLRRLIYIFAAAILGAFAYWLVLAALRFTPASYVTPIRAVSVVISAWIGVRYLQETGGRQRIIASCLVTIGIVLIAIAG